MSENHLFIGEIYLHWCPVSGKGYVGQTISGVANRWEDHLKASRRLKALTHSTAFSRAIRKYGSEAFETQVLSVAKSQAEMDNLEKVWIILLQTRAPRGYNIACGGQGGWTGLKHTSKTKAKIAAANTGNKYRVGLTHTEESKQKMSQNRKGKALGNKNAAGQEWTDERRQESSKKLKGKKKIGGSASQHVGGQDGKYEFSRATPHPGNKSKNESVSFSVY